MAPAPGPASTTALLASGTESLFTPSAPAAPAAAAAPLPTRRSLREAEQRAAKATRGGSRPAAKDAAQAPERRTTPAARSAAPAARTAAPAPAARSAAPVAPAARRAAPSGRGAAPAGRGATRSTPKRSSARRSPSQLSAPQVGIAGALGLATIAAPITGAMASPAPKAQVNTASALVSLAPAPAFPMLADSRAVGVEALRVIPAAQQNTSAPSMLAAREVVVSRASRAGERSVLPGCDGVARVTNASNGQIPSSSLCTLWESKHKLRADAAVALAKLNVAYKQQFGQNICLTDSYRTLASQYRLKSIKPGLAAQPGTSEHGWGLAIDACGGIQSGSGSSRYQWMRANAPDYGWDNPAWARPGGSGPTEAWHWEYVGA